MRVENNQRSLVFPDGRLTSALISFCLQTVG
jgi:hypothetical protein